MEKEQINEGADLLAREERVRKLQKKYAYKTDAERLEPFKNLFTFLTWPIQFFSALFAAGGVLLLLGLFNAAFYIVFFGAVSGLIFIELFKRWSYNEFNRERVSGENISKSIIIFCFVASGASVTSSYFGAPYAVEFFAAAPELIDTAQINSNFEARAAVAAGYWTGLSNEAQKRADKIHARNNRNGITRSRAVAAEQKELKLISSYADSLTKNRALIEADRRSALVAADLKNEATIKKNNGWVRSFGYWSAGVSLLLELSLFLILFWCSDYEKRELKEGEIIIKNKGPEPLKEVKKIIKDKVKEVVKQPLNEEKYAPGFFFRKDKEELKEEKETNKDEIKEGVIIPPIGRQRSARIYVMIDGKLNALRPGDLRNHIRGNEKTENKKRAEELKEHLKTLENFKP